VLFRVDDFQAIAVISRTGTAPGFGPPLHVALAEKQEKHGAERVQAGNDEKDGAPTINRVLKHAWVNITVIKR